MSKKGIGSLEDFTIAKLCTEKIDTQYGHIPYRDWCKLEIKRIGNPNFKMKYGHDEFLCGEACCITGKVKHDRET